MLTLTRRPLRIKNQTPQLCDAEPNTLNVRSVLSFFLNFGGVAIFPSKGMQVEKFPWMAELSVALTTRGTVRAGPRPG